jgi:aminomethyltransferase
MNYTPFYPSHLDSGGKIIDFGGWALPVNYGSQIKEHECVRSDAGMFDVSHMVITDVHGVDARAFVRHLISNDVAKLEKHGIGKALYSALLNQEAGIIDDLIVYLMPFGYRIVTNAATEAKVINWIRQVATGFKVEVYVRRDLAMLAVQGPTAIAKVSQALEDANQVISTLKPFTALELNNYLIARTGYTGEDGVEIMLPKEEAGGLWQQLLAHGVMPCGLGARDTLRLEAGLNLYGHEMDETITPLACNMDWVVDLTDETREFIGKRAYQLAKLTGDSAYQSGVVLAGKGILRAEQKLYANEQECGIVTSGTFAPSFKLSLGMARLNPGDYTQVYVDIRGNLEPIQLVKLPFIRGGKKCFNP